jgi:hypothetical protein
MYIPNDLGAKIDRYIAGKEKERIEQERRETAVNENKKIVVSGLVGIFSDSRVHQILDLTDAEISLFVHYDSSVAAVMTGGRPSYEIYVDKNGLSCRKNGNVAWVKEGKPDYEEWYSVFPYGRWFHDSSSGDYRFKQDPAGYRREIESKIEALLRGKK